MNGTIENGRVEKMCDHSWAILEAKQWKETSGYGSYHRRDQFFCSKCLELKIIARDYYCTSSGEMKYQIPDWFTTHHSFN